MQNKYDDTEEIIINQDSIEYKEKNSNIEDVMSEEAFNELIDNFEIVETLTEYGRKGIKENVRKMQKRINELEEEIKNEIKARDILVKLNEDSIPKQKVKDILQNNRNELFSITYVEPIQYKPFEMQIERINKIEKELLEEK
mgnify:CR=1 FL=1